MVFETIYTMKEIMDKVFYWMKNRDADYEFIFNSSNDRFTIEAKRITKFERIDDQ